MKSIIMFLLFVGLFMIVHSIYDEKLQEERRNKRVEYKFIPRSIYEDQFDETHVSKRFNNMFAPIDMQSDKPYSLVKE